MSFNEFYEQFLNGTLGSLEGENVKDMADYCPTAIVNGVSTVVSSWFSFT